jgi:two-component system sensor histidine kinase VicK
MSDYLALLRPFIARSQAVQFVYHLASQRIVYVSEAYEQVVGDPIEHVNEDLPRWVQRLHPDDRQLLRQRLEEAQPEEMVENIELRIMQPNGGTQWLCFSACRVLDSDGQDYLTGRLEDITKVKENGINAEKFNTKKNATLEILAHDLVAPLALLQQLTGFLADEVQADQSSVTQQLLTLMQRTCTQSVALIRDFVDNEFLESSSVVLNLKRTDMVVWSRTLIEEYQQSEAHMHLRFEYQAPEHPLYVEVDINKFQQVLNNLLSNAIKFTPDGGCIALSLTQEAEHVVITVADTGLGIPAHLLPVLFDKFTKARRPGLRGEHTTGLGMSVIQTLVHLHRGRITVDSKEGQGTTVRIELPSLPA